MNNFKYLIIFILAILFQGCATQKTLIPTGGSRADGTVKLSYEYGLFEKPQIDLTQGEIAAKQKCAAWGYTGADAFGGVTTTCNHYYRHGCDRWFATVEYQCTGAGRPN